MTKSPDAKSSLKEARAHHARLVAQIKKKQTLRVKQDRKKDTRKKILVGAVVLELMQNDAQLHQKVIAALHVSLRRAIDRAAISDLLTDSTAS